MYQTKSKREKMKYLFFIMVFGVLVSCTETQSDDYDFRNDYRPTYTKTVNVDQLIALDKTGVTIVDVRLPEDFAESPKLIRGAVHRNPEDIKDWISEIPRDKPVVLYCVKGKWVSQKAATYLYENGYDVFSLEGGIYAWNATHK